MKLVTTIQTIVTEKEWNTLIDAINVLEQLHHLLQDYDNEADIVSHAIDSIEEVTENIIDDYEQYH